MPLPRPGWEGREGKISAQKYRQLLKPGDGPQQGDGRAAAGQRHASAVIDASPAALPGSPDLLRKALPGGGAAISLLRNSEACAAASNPASGEHMPLEDERFGSRAGFGRFMARVWKDVAALADRAGPGVSLAHAAETLRMAVIDGQLGADLGPADKARMLYALYGARQAAEAQAALAPMLAATPGFQSLPPKQAWRMLLDQSAWDDDGRHAGLRFENEPGYMGGMYNGLSQVLQAHQQGRMFDASMLEQLHDAATQGVYPMRVIDTLRDEGPDFRSAAKCTRLIDAAVPWHAQGDPAERVHWLGAGFKGGGIGTFGLKADANVTCAGLDDFFAHQALYPKEQRCTMFTVNEREEYARLQVPSGWDGKSHLELMSPPLSRPQNKAKADTIIARYRKVLPRAATGDAKLAEIAKCVQRLEQAHLFMDGNARTTGFLVLNKLLLENGSRPAMIADPNRFDAYSINELVQEIRQGQKTFAGHC